MKRILLIRHCHAPGQHSDSPLSKNGIKQAHALSWKLENMSFQIDRIISSPYLRAQESIKPFAEKQHVDIEIDDRLKERILSEEPVDDWMDILEESFQNSHFKLPGGESSTEAYDRGVAVLNTCIQDETSENIAIVTHGNLLALMLRKFRVDFGFQEWKTLTNPDIFLIQRIGGEFITERIWDDTKSYD
ncbi:MULTISPECIES: histidine phosphatase family protein [Gracilibacillus]|uniref:histidine phosphatase family protein n=1 Tax=Gracilibacillus TaxID=74385 RepID=UPI0008245849|nr:MULTISPECIES: histidine phosphatase family protein [Gracilibacillus]